MPDKIAILMPTLDGGGAERSMLKLAQGFLARGHAVDLVICRNRGNLEAQLPAAARRIGLRRASTVRGRMHALLASPSDFLLLARPILFPWKTTWAVRYLPALSHYLRDNQPDVLLAGVTFFNLIAIWAKLRSGVNTRVIVTERSSLTRNIAIRLYQWRRRYLAALVRQTYPRAHAITAVSDGAGKDLASITGLAQQSITTLYNPVFTDDLLEQARQPLDHPWFADKCIPVVLAAGMFVEAKDFPTLLRAFAKLRAVMQVRLVLLGSGKPKSTRELKDLAKQLGLSSDVDFAGWQDNPFKYMARASVFVLSSRYEGLPGVLIQAMACGCPVVSTDCPSGPREILCDGEFGPLVPVGDAQALANAMHQVLLNPPDSSRRVARAASFNIDNAVQAYLRICSA